MIDNNLTAAKNTLEVSSFKFIFIKIFGSRYKRKCMVTGNTLLGVDFFGKEYFIGIVT